MEMAIMIARQSDRNWMLQKRGELESWRENTENRKRAEGQEEEEKAN